MTDKFRQERRAAFNPNKSEETNLESVHQAQRSLGTDVPQQVEISGNIPPELKDAMISKTSASQRMAMVRNKPEPTFNPRDPYSQFKDQNFEEVMRKLTDHHHYDEVILPSLGKFYEPHQCPPGGKIHVRPMTGAEEQILATPRYIKKGEAINRIFKACCREKIEPESFLTIDREFLIIFLRGISYSHEYDVEVKCPECNTRFNTSVNLASLDLRECPEDFGPSSLRGVLPTSGFSFTYRLSNGKDEQMVTEHRERNIKEFGDNAVDDTLLFRTVLLLEEIEGIKTFNALKIIVSKLPINDVAYLRNLVNEPPFGVNTNVGIDCPNCPAEFEVEIPFDANFFFPRRKKEEQTRVEIN